ncbi:COG1361 family protein [Nocardia suismassiliense]|uniref:hypothetical protein n=1 Tax=Nocardia suismassiliense TaxID=2077092 RepID=UPI00131EEE2E|nr:hypothetical protein [Nocardia suismassiliense]
MTGNGSTGIEVTNVGPSIARNVRVSFDPPLPTHGKTLAGTPSLLPYLRRRYSKPIAAWPPGYTLKNEYLFRAPDSDGQPDEDGVQPNTDGVPRETAIVFDYTDDDGYLYTDRTPLDPILIQGETWSTITRKGAVVHDAAPWKQ